MDAVTAISGSGPAYVFYLVDALAEAGVLLGLTRAQSLDLARATFRGAAELLEQSGEHPVVLRERVSSPGGTTVAALRELDAHGVRAAVIAAAEAARDRSRALGGPAAGTAGVSPSGRRPAPAMSDVAASPASPTRPSPACSTTTRACARRPARGCSRRSRRWATGRTSQRAPWSPGAPARWA